MNATVRGLVLGSAVLTTGLFAGLFVTFSVGVMPGLHRTDPRTLIDAMQQMDRAIAVNPFFMGILLGAPVLAAVAAALHLDPEHRRQLWWILAALALCVVVLAITGAVNLPLHDDLAAAGAPDQLADPEAVREAFETPWVVANIARSVLATAGFACLLRAAMLAGTALSAQVSHRASLA